MFVISFRATRKKIAAICCVIIAAVVLATIALLGGNSESVDAAAQGSTNDQRVEYLNSMGWEVEEEAASVQDVVIPSEFDSVYDVYNSIQKQQGFDLSEYKGETCKQYVYKITNYPDSSDYMVATLMVYNGSIIGGDVSSTETEGYMHRLQRTDTSQASSDGSVQEEQTETESEQPNASDQASE